MLRFLTRPPTGLQIQILCPGAGNNAGKRIFQKKKGLDFYIQPLVFLWRAREDSNPRPIA